MFNPSKRLKRLWWIALFASATAIGVQEDQHAAGRDLEFTKKQLELPGKKGVCFTLRRGSEKKPGNIASNVDRLKALNVSWNYSWGLKYIEEQPPQIEFIPMTWGSFRNTGWQAGVIADIEAGRVKRFLGFNEPDKQEQANMPYTRAIELWPELEKLGVPLCSPACANAEGISDSSAQDVRGTWMPDFMEEAEGRGYRIDYIGVHWYGGCSVSSFQEKMKRIYRMYGRRPLLITEFAPADWKARSPADNRHSPAAVLEFMKEVLPWMEKQDWIAGYAWFSFGIDSPVGTSSALFDEDGKLTACGRYYRSVTPDNPRGDQRIKPDKP